MKLITPWLSKAFILPDIHVPFHDKKYFRLMLKILAAGKYDTLIILGDFIDCWSVSRHSKDPRRKLLLADELKMGKAALWAISKAAGENCKIVFIEGNHEHRLTRYLQDRAPELVGLVSVPEALGFRELGIKFIPYRDHWKYGKIFFTHDLDFAGRNAVFRNLDSAQHSIGVGHTHRACITYEGSAVGKSHISATYGHGLDLNTIDYKHKIKAHRDWHQAFGEARIEQGTGYTYTQVVPVINYRVCLNGELFTL